jgi:hypothetical protein
MTPTDDRPLPIRHHRVERLPADDSHALICVRCAVHADDYGAYMDDPCDSPEARRDDHSGR